MSIHRALLLLSLAVGMTLSACAGPGFQELRLGASDRYQFTSEADLEDLAQRARIDAFFDAQPVGAIIGVAGVWLRYKTFENPAARGAIVIANGRTESIPKYRELIYDLYRNGYSVYVVDHRGQGWSDRVYRQQPEMGYVDNFDYYVTDLKRFHDQVVEPGGQRRAFLLAHSMGTAIAVRYVQRYPEDFRALALSSPMFGLPSGTCPVAAALAGTSIRYAPTQKNYEAMIPVMKPLLTTSDTRYRMMIDTEAAHPEVRLGGATYQWLARSCLAMDAIFSDLESIRLPVLVLQAGDEGIVSPGAQNDFASGLTDAGGNVMAYHIEGAKHELLIERDLYRDAVLREILDFFARY